MSTPGADQGSDYTDRDLPDGDTDPGEGAYTDQQTPPEARGEEADRRGPDDRGEYDDSDVSEGHRGSPPVQGGYTSKD